MGASTTFRMIIGNGGWVCWRSAEGVGYVRLALAQDGRLEIRDIFLPFDSGPSVRRLRDVATDVGEVERTANLDADCREAISDRLEMPAPDLRTAVSYYREEPGARDGQLHWAQRMLLSQVDSSDEPRPPPAEKPDSEAATPRKRTWVVEDVVLKPPARKPYPDQFYSDIARIYRDAARDSDHPALRMAQAGDVSVKTVHRWVAEARRRGHLAPGRAGRAG